MMYRDELFAGELDTWQEMHAAEAFGRSIAERQLDGLSHLASVACAAATEAEARCMDLEQRIADLERRAAHQERHAAHLNQIDLAQGQRLDYQSGTLDALIDLDRIQGERIAELEHLVDQLRRLNTRTNARLR